MNDDLQQRLAAYLDAIEASASKAGDFVGEQTPLLAQEFLAWEFWSSVLLCVASALAAIAIAAMLLRVWWSVKGTEEFDLYDHPETAFLFIPIILLAVSTGGILHNGFNAAKIKIAPRVVLMEKVAELSK